MSYKKQTDLNVVTFCTILKKHQLKSGSRLHQHLLCSIVLVPTIWVHVIDLKPIYKVSSHPFVLSVLVLDGFGGGGVHRRIGGIASLFWKVLKFLWNPLTLLRLFFFPKNSKINIFLGFTPICFVLGVPLLPRDSRRRPRPGDVWMGKDSHR